MTEIGAGCLLQKSLTLGIAYASVLVEGVLRDAVERQRRNRAVQARRGHAPFAHGAAPPGKVIGIDPDQTFLHAAAFLVDFDGKGDSRLCARGGTGTGGGGTVAPRPTQSRMRT